MIAVSYSATIHLRKEPYSVLSHLCRSWGQQVPEAIASPG